MSNGSTSPAGFDEKILKIRHGDIRFAASVEIETPEILKALSTASRHLGKLNGLCASLPDPQMLINTIALQESKDSSAIENIVTTQDELYKGAIYFINYRLMEILSQ